ncbi:ABC transporter ATP-binding protein [Paenibacillus albicereus]|uniref:ABC transporter ATP-binding protein n=1 Tax=Paenibacillus albicereus TaxID=2726185 RepID=A0A6H2GUQ9_9BACL|nr:ABC transporter ATP-binding protein [Paenibacillus albicereus]QJC51089.1 ABC transporter ATP-binding protein [Paenibacillus albicereus]
MAGIELVGLSKRFKQETVIENLSLSIRDGSFTVLVGPSGCGKSTLLRMVAGLERQSEGRIWIGGRDVSETPPGLRDVAMVFQNYALYPTMSVRGNIEFGLRNKGVPKAQRERLIGDISDIVGLAPYLDKKPQSLSGGQRQRVALARAMVKQPQVFILDEPLSNLDAKLRGQMRTELIQLHKRLGTTFVYVTHDQVEAMSMGDEIVIMDKGVIQQADRPMRLYEDPDNLFAAQFIGTPAMNVLRAEDLETLELPRMPLREPGRLRHVGFRPEHAAFAEPGSPPRPGMLRLYGEIVTRESLGAEQICQLRLPTGTLAAVKTFLQPLAPEGRAAIDVPAERLYAFGEDGRRLRETAPGEAELALAAGEGGGR